MRGDQSVTNTFQEVDRGPSIKRSHLYVQKLKTQILLSSSCHLNMPAALSPLSFSGRTYTHPAGVKAMQ